MIPKSKKRNSKSNIKKFENLDEYFLIPHFPYKKFQTHVGPINHVNVHYNFIISCGNEGIISFWNLDGKFINSIKSSKAEIYSFDCYNNYLICGGRNKELYFFDINYDDIHGKMKYSKKVFRGHSDVIFSSRVFNNNFIIGRRC